MYYSLVNFGCWRMKWLQEGGGVILRQFKLCLSSPENEPPPPGSPFIPWQSRQLLSLSLSLHCLSVHPPFCVGVLCVGVWGCGVCVFVNVTFILHCMVFD